MGELKGCRFSECPFRTEKCMEELPDLIDIGGPPDSLSLSRKVGEFRQESRKTNLGNGK